MSINYFALRAIFEKIMVHITSGNINILEHLKSQQLR